MSTLSNGCCDDQTLGAQPANIKWNVVRGDTATLMVQFYENDETTYYDTTLWSYIATAYNPRTNTYYDLDIEDHDGYIKITALPAITAEWGTGIQSTVAELSFDVQVTTGDNSVWTPVIGIISVAGDVTGVANVSS